MTNTDLIFILNSDFLFKFKIVLVMQFEADE